MPDATTAAQFVLKALNQEGIRHVFMVPGGLIDEFMYAFGDATGVTAIVAAHETGAGFMADGYARASGRFGVCMGIGGPGVANLVPAIASAYADESPILVLGGEVPSDWEARGAFQDGSAADVEMMQPITAFSKEVPVATALPRHLNVALRTMVGAVPQPVFLSLPQQIQKQPVTEAYRPLRYWVDAPPRVLDHDQVSLGILDRVSRIAILAGNGTVRSGAAEELKKVAELFQIPVATTLRAKGVFPEDHPLSLGVFGYGGTRHSTLAIAPKTDPDYTPLNVPPAELLQAELLLILGSGLNQRDTMFWSPQLPKYSVQVDIDAAAFGRNYPVSADPQSDYPERTAVLADVREFLRWLLEQKPLMNGVPARQKWSGGISLGPRYYDKDNMRSEAVPIHPARVVTELGDAAPRDCMLLVDSGTYRVFGAHYWRSFAPRQYLTATTLAPMGWAIAAAVGAKLAMKDVGITDAEKNRPCAVITGDGCMLMHGNEIQTAARYGLGIIYVVINNGAHGNIYLGVKQNPAAAALTLLPTHNWAQYAQALGCDGVVVDKPGDLAAAFQKAFAQPLTKPLVIDVRCDREASTPIGPWKRARQASLD
jgi:acetolactate synthase-1/2/3 large subunit